MTDLEKVVNVPINKLYFHVDLRVSTSIIYTHWKGKQIKTLESERAVFKHMVNNFLPSTSNFFRLNTSV